MLSVVFEQHVHLPILLLIESIDCDLLFLTAGARLSLLQTNLSSQHLVRPPLISQQFCTMHVYAGQLADYNRLHHPLSLIFLRMRITNYVLFVKTLICLLAM
jgi:hypothetical protein